MKMLKNIKKSGWMVLAVFVLALIALIIFWDRLGTLTSPDFLAAPNPNAYELFLKAEERLEGLDPLSVTNNYAGFVAGHREMFEEFEKALGYEAEAPARAYDSAQMPVRDLLRLKRLAFAIMIQAKEAREEGRWSDAARVYLEVMRFGQKVERGPLINFMVGSAIELMGIKLLGQVNMLSAGQLSDSGAQLLEVDGARIGFDEVKRRERYFMKMNREDFLTRVRGLFRSKQIFEDVHERYLDTAALAQVVAANMAIRQFELAEKRKPRELADLVPKYLSVMPRDPFTSRPLILAQLGTNSVAYSAGPNKKDDGGKVDDVAGGFQDSMGGKIVVDALQRIAK
jgi:hypothetical protein